MFHNREEDLTANVLAIRKRLKSTEKSLQNLGEELKDNSSEHSDYSSQCSFPVGLTLEDLDWPDEAEPLSSSQHITRSRRMAEHKRPSNSAGANTSSRVRANGQVHCHNCMTLSFSGLSSSSRMIELENKKLRKTLSVIQEENNSLISENHQLLTDLESVQFELTDSKSKIRLLESTLTSKVVSVPELEDQIIGLEAEVEAQENALRDAEEKLEESHQTVKTMERAMEKMKEELRRVKTEFSEQSRLGKRAEQQRNEALINAEKLTVAFQQNKDIFSEKLKKLCENEGRLKSNLVQCESEREELQKKCFALEQEMEGMRRHIRKLKEGCSKDQVTLSNMEAEKTELLSALTESNQKISILESELTAKDKILEEKGSLKRENQELRTLTTQQSERLVECQREIEETQSELASLESILSQLNNREVEVGTINTKSSSSNHSLSSSLGNSSEQTKALVQDLRLQLSEKEAEIQKLQAKAAQHLSQMSQGSTSSTQTELSSMKPAEKKYQQLQPLILGLEEEKRRQESQIRKLQSQLVEAEAEICSLQTRMDQRTSQFQEIQNELLDKAAEANKLEREMKKRNSQLLAVEKQLAEKSSAYSTAVSRTSDLELELMENNNQIQSLKRILKKEQKDALLAGENAQTLHIEQCKELEGKIEMLQSDVEQKQLKLKEQARMLSILQQDSEAKHRRVESLQSALAQTRQELEIKTKRNDEAFRDFQDQAEQAAEKIRYLEAALSTCKDELKFYLREVEDHKEHFEMQLQKKSEEVHLLQKEMKCSMLTLQETSEQNMLLQQTLQQQQQMLQQGSGRIGELEDSQAELERQVSKLEQELQKQKQAAKEELGNTEEKLRKVCQESEDKERQMKMEMDDCRNKLTEVEKELLKLRRDSNTKASQLDLLECTLHETQGQLDKKSDLVVDLEEKLHRSEADRRNSLQRTQLLEAQLMKVRGELVDTMGQLQELSDMLQKTQLSVGEKEAAIEKLATELRECKGELEDRNNELLDMDQALKERQWELKQRAGQITKLDVTVRDHKNEMEQKIIGLEAEVKEGQKLIESLEEKLQFAKKQLQEKHMFEKDSLELTRDQLQRTQLELQEARRQGGQLVQELDKTNQEKVGLLDEIQELIKTHLREKNKFEMEALELEKQVRLAREQLQHTHLELQEAGRQGERLAQELDETIQLSQEKEVNTIRLAEELGATQARSRQVEVQMQAKLKALQEEMEQLQEAHRQELLGLQESQAKLLMSTGTLSSSLKSTQDNLNERLHEIKRELEEAERNILNLQAELHIRDGVIQAANEALVIKESEVARLQAKISSYERTVGLQNTSSLSMLSFVGQSNAHVNESVMQTQSSFRDLRQSRSASDTNPHCSDTDSLDLPRSIADSLENSIMPLMKSNKGLQGSIENDGTCIQDESSFNPLTYTVADETLIDSDVSDSGKPDLDTLSGMLRFINNEMTEPASFHRSAVLPGLKQITDHQKKKKRASTGKS
ncbi:coiled-coil domain-containing protein 18-like isoform X1 [Acipenser ruthenus]|uniref:coiled-coil domain-containing protein 18-like isoform X1 n=1 Tax=Acipenser ruthenus TaxID=7906 RepID=UPI0027422C86|nr:coiled-coil domain-containing protein 18-like isoform X1 [Acipenser ruthenus]